MINVLQGMAKRVSRTPATPRHPKQFFLNAFFLCFSRFSFNKRCVCLQHYDLKCILIGILGFLGYACDPATTCLLFYNSRCNTAECCFLVVAVWTSLFFLPGCIVVDAWFWFGTIVGCFTFFF